MTTMSESSCSSPDLTTNVTDLYLLHQSYTTNICCTLYQLYVHWNSPHLLHLISVICTLKLPKTNQLVCFIYLFTYFTWFTHQCRPSWERESRWLRPRSQRRWPPDADTPRQWWASAGERYGRRQSPCGCVGCHLSARGSYLSGPYRGWRTPWRLCVRW